MNPLLLSRSSHPNPQDIGLGVRDPPQKTLIDSIRPFAQWGLYHIDMHILILSGDSLPDPAEYRLTRSEETCAPASPVEL